MSNYEYGIFNRLNRYHEPYEYCGKIADAKQFVSYWCDKYGDCEENFYILRCYSGEYETADKVWELDERGKWHGREFDERIIV